MATRSFPSSPILLLAQVGLTNALLRNAFSLATRYTPSVVRSAETAYARALR